MLRKTIFVLISFLFVVTCLYAQQQTPAQNQPQTTQPGTYDIGNPQEKILIDFANLPEGLDLTRWKIKLSGYSDNPTSRSLSDLKVATVDQAKLDTDVKFSKCLGIHIYFEYSHGNDWAQISPILPLSDYYTKEGEGILRNVGPIKSISLWADGRNYKNSIEVRMKDETGHYKGISFGNLFFRGWRKLTWINPDYIKELQKRDITKVHLYPQYEPYLKFDSIIVYKSPQEIGGDFITYVKDVRVECEEALIKRDEPINDEAEWKIQQTEAQKMKIHDDNYYDLYYSGSSFEQQYLKDKAKRDKLEQQQQQQQQGQGK